MSRIFLSYRREDSAPYAGRIYDRLTAHFGAGQVFMDIDQIEPGEDFVEVINRKVGDCDTAVVLIGKAWLSAGSAEVRRLDNPEDFVRLEIAAALQRGVRVVPVLVGGAAMPTMQQLPEPLGLLSRRNALEISDTRFHSDVDRLLKALERIQPVGAATVTQATPPAEERGDATPRPAPGAGTKRTKRWALAVGVAAIGLAVIVAFFGKEGASEASLDAATSMKPVNGETLAATVPAPAADEASMLADARVEAEKQRLAALSTFRELERIHATVLLGVQHRAAAGSAESQYLLAMTYECGEKRDLSEALRWYSAAANQGYQPAREFLEAFRQALPTDGSGRAFGSLKQEMQCLSRLQQTLSTDLDVLNKKNIETIRTIRP